MTAESLKEHFQTPPALCQYMRSLVPAGVKTILEPTPGKGNLVAALEGYKVIAPKCFFKFIDHPFDDRYDCVVMNPPFSLTYTLNIPDHLNKKGFQVGYYILQECMEMSSNIIALLPWFVITNSAKRWKDIRAWGLKSMTVVPRIEFPGSRASSCILELTKGYNGPIDLKTFEK